MTAHAPDSTRERVLQIVLMHGPISAADVGSRLSLTAAAVRRHLDALSEDGTVEVKLVAGNRGAGRPSRRYVVSQQGQAALGDDYLDIAADALDLLVSVQGTEAVRQVARQRFTAVEERFEHRLADHQRSHGELPDLQGRTDLLAQVLDEFDFAASVRSAGGPQKGRPILSAAQLCQGHCPFQEIAARFPEFCEEETAVFARLLQVDVRRLATMPTGGHVCTTHVPLGRPPAAT